MVRGRVQIPLVRGGVQISLVRGRGPDSFGKGEGPDSFGKGKGPDSFGKGEGSDSFGKGGVQIPLVRGRVQIPLVRGRSQISLVRGIQIPLVRGRGTDSFGKGEGPLYPNLVMVRCILSFTESRIEFLEKLARVCAQVSPRSPTHPILSTAGSTKLVVGNWTLSCQTEGELVIHNSDGTKVSGISPPPAPL